MILRGWGATSLLKMVNAAIRELKGSEEYRQIIRKYLGGTGPAPIAKVAGQWPAVRGLEAPTLLEAQRKLQADLGRISAFLAARGLVGLLMPEPVRRTGRRRMPSRPASPWG